MKVIIIVIYIVKYRENYIIFGNIYYIENITLYLAISKKLSRILEDKTE